MSLRAVLDVNVIISAPLSPRGAPAGALRAWLQGEIDLVVSPAPLTELERALAYPKLAARVTPSEAEELIDLLSRTAIMVDDPPGPPPVRSADPDDDDVLPGRRCTGGDRVGRPPPHGPPWAAPRVHTRAVPRPAGRPVASRGPA